MSGNRGSKIAYRFHVAQMVDAWRKSRTCPLRGTNLGATALNSHRQALSSSFDHSCELPFALLASNRSRARALAPSNSDDQESAALPQLPPPTTSRPRRRRRCLRERRPPSMPLQQPPSWRPRRRQLRRPLHLHPPPPRTMRRLLPFRPP